MSESQNRVRILTIDDNEQIHQDFRRCLTSVVEVNNATSDLDAMEAIMFGPGANAPVTKVERESYRLDSVLQGQDALEKVIQAKGDRDPYQVAFVDMRMPPGWDGLQTIEAIWGIDPDLQVVICTAYSDYSWDEIQTRLGRNDQLLILRKPFDPVEVRQMAASLSQKWQLSQLARIKKAELENLVRVRTQQLEEAMQQDRVRLDMLETLVGQRTAELRHAALHDRLTGLPNRSMISDQLARVLQNGHENPSALFAVLFLDLDDFKLVNDTLGHLAGDQLLTCVAERIKSAARMVEGLGFARVTAARLGGDEFVVLMENLRYVQDAENFASQLLEDVSRPYTVMDREVRCGVSIGITSSLTPHETVEQLLRNADIAMYRAKVAKNRYVVFTPEMHEQVVARVSLEDEIRRGIDRNEFVLHYQPIVSLSTGELHGFEALARWNHPERGCIGPDAFIPLAERTGLIFALGRKTIEIAAAQLAEWQTKYPQRNLSLSVNLSTRQLSDENLPTEIDAIVRKAGADPSRFILEITEGVLSENELADRLIAKFRSMNFRTYIDDFGTGHSSLGRLPVIPFDGLKIDRVFLRTASRQRKYAAIINAIINLAHHMDAVVIAEGIESADQLALLQTLNCELGQGYYFSRPIAAEKVDSLLAEPWRTMRIAA